MLFTTWLHHLHYTKPKYSNFSTHSLTFTILIVFWGSTIIPMGMNWYLTVGYIVFIKTRCTQTFEDAAAYFMNPQDHAFKNRPHTRFLVNCFFLCHPSGHKGKWHFLAGLCPWSLQRSVDLTQPGPIITHGYDFRDPTSYVNNASQTNWEACFEIFPIVSSGRRSISWLHCTRGYE